MDVKNSSKVTYLIKRLPSYQVFASDGIIPLKGKEDVYRFDFYVASEPLPESLIVENSENENKIIGGKGLNPSEFISCNIQLGINLSLDTIIDLHKVLSEILENQEFEKDGYQ